MEDVFYEFWYFRNSNTVEKIEQMNDEKKLDLYISSMNHLNNK